MTAGRKLLPVFLMGAAVILARPSSAAPGTHYTLTFTAPATLATGFPECQDVPDSSRAAPLPAHSAQVIELWRTGCDGDFLVATWWTWPGLTNTVAIIKQGCYPWRMLVRARNPAGTGCFNSNVVVLE